MKTVEYIPTNARVFIAGKTGTGKSYLAENYLAKYEYVVKLDTKGEAHERRQAGENLWRGLKEGKDFKVIEHLTDLPYVDTKKIIYVPSMDEMTWDTYDEFFKYIYLRENTILWIDELMSITNSPLKVQPWLRGLYTRGRSKNIGVWALTQRPSGIPGDTMANSEVFISFDLRLPADREKLAKMTGCPEFLTEPSSAAHPYAFWYYQDDWNEPILAELS